MESAQGLWEKLEPRIHHAIDLVDNIILLVFLRYKLE